MKKYDKVYIPNALSQQETEYLLCKESVPHPLVGLDQKENVIVLTVEELREVYALGIKEIGRYVNHEGWQYAKDSRGEDVFVRKDTIERKIQDLLKEDDGYQMLYNFKTFLRYKGIQL